MESFVNSTESLFTSIDGYTFISGAILVYLSTAINLAMRSLLVLGAIAVYKYVGKLTRWCLLIGSILFALSAVGSLPLLTIVWGRFLTVETYAYFSIFVGFVSNLGLFLFAIGFFRLCQKLVKFKNPR